MTRMVMLPDEDLRLLIAAAQDRLTPIGMWRRRWTKAEFDRLHKIIDDNLGKDEVEPDPFTGAGSEVEAYRG